MPIKEYECADCGTRFETLIRSSDVEPPSCPACGSQELQGVLTYPGNYSIKGDNSSSQRPRGGLTARKKVIK